MKLLTLTRRRILIAAIAVVGMLVVWWLSLAKSDGFFDYLATHSTAHDFAREVSTYLGTQDAFDDRVYQAQLRSLRE